MSQIKGSRAIVDQLHEDEESVASHAVPDKPAPTSPTREEAIYFVESIAGPGVCPLILKETGDQYLWHAGQILSKDCPCEPRLILLERHPRRSYVHNMAS